MLAEVMAAKREIAERTQGGRLRRIDPKFVQQVKEAQAQAHLSDKEFARMLSISSFQLRNLYSRGKTRVGRPAKAKRITPKAPFLRHRVSRIDDSDNEKVRRSWWTYRTFREHRKEAPLAPSGKTD